MSLTVREKYAWQQFMDEKANGMGNLITGIPRFVVPGTSAANLAFVSDRHKYVYTSVNAAYADCVAGQGDAIILTPGAHTLTANIAASKANVYIMGPESYMGVKTDRPSASITPLAATDGFTVTAADFSLIGVVCVPITAKNFMTFSAAANRLRIKDCFLDMVTPAVNISTVGFAATGAAIDAHISGLQVYSGGAQGPAIDVTALLRSTISDSDFQVIAGTWAVVIQTGAATKGVRIDKSHFGGYGTAITGAIDGTGANTARTIIATDNRAGAICTLFKNFGANTTYVDLCNNYVATVGGGTGGTLVTAIT